MNIDKLLEGLYGEEAARNIFESLCGLFVLNETKQVNFDTISSDEMKRNEKVFSENITNENYEKNSLSINNNIYHMQTRKGDGGIDILVESGDIWFVYQCKFFTDKLTESKKTGKDYLRSNRIKQIENSFNKAFETANSANKKIVKWILCIPRDLDDLEKRWFDDFKNKNSNKCQNIKLIGNLQLRNWLINNEKIYHHYFLNSQTKTSEKSELNVFNVFKSYREGFEYDLINAYSPSARRRSSLTNQTNLNLFFKYLNGFKEQFYKVYDLFLEIDQRANLNKEQYETYKANLMMNNENRIAFGNNIDKEAEEIQKLTQKKEIEEYKRFLRNITENFSDYYF